MLLMMRDLGVTVQNVFALPEYTNPFTNTANSANQTTPLFGAVVDMGGQTNLRRPLFLAEQLANSAILPYLLTTTVSGANPTWNQPLSTNDNIQLAAAHEIQVFAFSDGGKKRSIIAFNLSRTQSLPVKASGAGAPTDVPVSISLLTSTNLTDTNEAGAKVAIQTETVNGFSSETVAYLPPYSMVVLQWSVN
jgi:alpha-L-arabinofuranosidase